MAKLFNIISCGTDVSHTNFWDSEHARFGYFYFDWVPGMGRLLMPDAFVKLLEKMRPAKRVIVSRGPCSMFLGGDDCIELKFDDGNQAPFRFILEAVHCSHLEPLLDQRSSFDVAIWTRSGCEQTWPGQYRKVDEIAPF